jgi:hypothetical protein
MSLVSLSLGFSAFGILIFVNRHRAEMNGASGDSFVAAVGGIGGLVIGVCFLVAACLHWRTISGPSWVEGAKHSHYFQVVPVAHPDTGWKPMLHYTVAGSLRARGTPVRKHFERSLDTPESNVA